MKITHIVKHHLLVIIVYIWSFAKIIGVIDARKLLYLNQSRFGHLVGDTLAFITTNTGNDFILPVWNPASEYFVAGMQKKITVVYSKFLVYMSGVLRNTKHAYDCSNMLNCYIDEIYPNSIFKRNKFNLNNLNTNKIKKIVDEVLLDDEVLRKYQLECENYICFNLRTGYMTEHTEEQHGFRNSNPEEVVELLEYLKSLNKTIVNLSNIKFKGLVNIIYEECYRESDIFTIISKSMLYVGDSSGPLIYAQLIGKKTFGYNIYPLYLKPNNNSYFSYMKIEDYDESYDYFHDEILLKSNNIVVKKDIINLDFFKNFWEKK